MHSNENSQYLSEIWSKVRIQEYDRHQLEKAEENKKLLRNIEIRMSCFVFGSLSIMSILLYFILGVSMVWLIICIPAFLSAAQLYEYVRFKVIKRRIYLEN